MERVSQSGQSRPRASGLEAIFTMNEAAARLRVCRRVLQEVVKKNPFYFSNGRRKLFTETDLADLVSAMREDKPCPSNSFRPANSRRHSGPSEEPTSESMWTEAQRRLVALSPPRLSRSGKTKSSKVPLRAPTNPHF